MTYNVFGWTLNLTQSINQSFLLAFVSVVVRSSVADCVDRLVL